MDIVIEMYFENDHAAGPDDETPQGWNVILWEADEDGEPRLDGWEAQPFGDERFTFKQAKALLDRMQIRYRGRAKIRTLIGVEQRPPRQYPRTPMIYRSGAGCERAGFNDTA